MQVHFKNNTSVAVSVAVMYYDPGSCGGDGDFSTHGWWNLQPGEEKYPFSSTNEFAYYYAFSADGRLVWNGDVGPVYVYFAKFDSCLNIGSTAADDQVGMRTITLPWYRSNPLATHTVNLNQG
jgi:uncharacterized membrane protein